MGQSGTLGDLALVSRLSDAPVGNASQFRANTDTDYRNTGLGSATGKYIGDWNDPPLISCFLYAGSSGAGNKPPGGSTSGWQLVSDGALYIKQFGGPINSGRLSHRSGESNGDGTYTWGDWAPFYEGAATATVDGNGFLKAASPIFRLGAQAEDEQHKVAGAGTANTEAQGVTAEHVEIGVYRVSGARGFAAEGWRAELPRGGDGSKRCLIETETGADGTIAVRVYSIATNPMGERVAHELMDIPGDTFVTLRLLMPTTKTTDDDGKEIEVETTAEHQADITVDHLRPATYKLDIWDRMSDDEAETFEAEFGNVGAKLRGMWRDCRYIDHDSPLFSTLRTMMSEQWGEARADELLASSYAQAAPQPQ